MIEVKNVTKSYGMTKALKDVSFTLAPGEIVGLFGENGAGKTTLLKCMLTLLRHGGSVSLDGAPITRENIDRLSFSTSEHSFFPGLSAAAHRDFYREHFPKFREKRFAALMDFFELPMHKTIRSFSTGQKNQFEVLLALSQGADYILMDEPFAGNDVFNREDFYRLLLGMLEEGETILLSTHLIEEVSGFVTRALLLHRGELIGDITADALEEQGRSLMDAVKEHYHYRADRVARALGSLTEEGS